MALFGLLWHFPALTATTGVVVENRRLAPPRSHVIVYEYEVDGIRHRGQRVWRYDTQFENFYRVGSPFQVFYFTAHPERSYGPNRPLWVGFVVLGIFVAAASAVVIFYTWPR